MTKDKQIIIDGYDVSGCTHKKNDACMAITNFCGDFKHYCDDLNDCYYKRLKRKEQECERLKKTLTEIKPILEPYANSNIGEEQPDGTYKFSGKYFEQNDTVFINYDPRPAKKALQKISECEATNER